MTGPDRADVPGTHVISGAEIAWHAIGGTG